VLWQIIGELKIICGADPDITGDEQQLQVQKGVHTSMWLSSAIFCDNSKAFTA
jgi:hypothetical protein